MREHRGAIALLLILMVQVFVPIFPVDATSGRTTPDFTVSVMTLSAGGSIDDGGDIILGDGLHVLRIVVTNQGSASGEVTLNILHQASAISSETSVTSIDLGVVDAASSTGSILVNWTATLGDEQTLFARVASAEDINALNDEASIDFDVKIHHVGTILTDTIPSPSIGFTDVRLDHTVHTFNATVRNDGVNTITAVFELNFTDSLDPLNQLAFWSGTVMLEPGSLLNPSVGEELSTTFDAASILNTWTMVARVHFNGSLWTNIPVAQVETVTFSDYIIELSSPNDRAIEPGATTSLTWIVHNLGLADVFTIELGSDLGWHDDTQEGSTVTVGAGASSAIIVPVSVPIDAVKPSLENVYLNLTSTNDAYVARSTGHIMVGDQYKATIVPPVGPITITPAQTSSLLFTVNNSGNVPSAFNLAAGLSVAAENWGVELSTPITDVLAVDDEVSISVQITPAPLSSPNDPNERNGAGDALSVWLQAMPVDGGVPSIGSVQTIIRSIIAVDPAPETEMLVLTEEQVLASSSGGIDEIISLSVQVRHNLGSAITGGVNANITVGDITFVATTSGGLNEANRWNTNVTPENVTSLEIGEIFQSWLLIDGPSDEMPMAGVLTVPVTAMPNLTAAQQSSGILASSVTRNISVVIPSVVAGEIITEGPLSADVGNMTNFTLQLANTGNDFSSYRVSIVDDLPELWSATLSTSEAGSSTVVDNLTPAMSDHPITGEGHIQNLTLKVTTDPQAPADTFQPLTVRVEESLTGELLSLNTLMIRVEESINFELFPTNDSVDLSPYETPLTRVYVNNTGNVATLYTIWMDRSLENAVEFIIESPLEIVVAPGESESVKIRLRPDSEASADEVHVATLWVSATGGMNLSASIVANISADHHLFIDAPDQVEVVPGANETIAITLSNTGNLEENLNISAVVDVGWETSLSSDEVTLPIDGSLANTLTVVVPSFGGTDKLAEGDIHELTISLYQIGDGSFITSRVIQLVVAPVFMLEVEAWPDEMKYHAGWSRDWNVTLTNIGNKDVSVDLTWDVFKPGLEITSNDWEVVGAPDTLIMEQDVPVSLKFSVDMIELQPDVYLSADLRLTVIPDDPEISGSTIFETKLQVSRLFSYTDYKLFPSSDESNLTEQISWSHIPQGVDSPVSYLIELCDAERLVNLTQLGLNSTDYNWEFALDNDGTYEPLDLSNSCDGASHLVIPLPARVGWVQTDPLIVVINTPNRPNILRNDGYNLTFRLYHPDEHNSFTEYTEATFKFFFATKSEPVLKDLDFAVDTLEEGMDTKITATVSNTGTSIALSVSVELLCEGIGVEDTVVNIAALPASTSADVAWDVRTDYLDWWGQTSEVKCSATLTAMNWKGETIVNAPVKLDSQVESWSPGVGVSFIATLALIGASIALLRLVGQNDKFRLAAIYSGLIGLGFAFHLLDMTWWGPAVMILSAGWVWFMTWKSTDEFQLIHEDYQRARKGISTMYSDHVEVLTNSRRQLSIILAMPILGMITVVLGIPPQMNPDSTNMMSLILYVVVVIVGVWLLIWQSNRMYGSLYGRLTEVEVKSNRIERDLGDPARLLTELASEGIDLSSIISAPQPSVAAEGEATPEDIHDWDEEINTLLDEEEGEDQLSELEAALSFDSVEDPIAGEEEVEKVG